MDRQPLSYWETVLAVITGGFLAKPLDALSTDLAEVTVTTIVGFFSG